MRRSFTRTLLTLVIAGTPAMMSSCDLPIDFWVDQTVHITIGYPWAPGAAYGEGNVVLANGAYYIETVKTCTSASSGAGPTGMTGSPGDETPLSDGTCNWDFVGQTWQPNTSYSQGTVLLSQSNIYKETVDSCTSASSGSGPTGTTTGIADGTCSWDFDDSFSINQNTPVSLNNCSTCQAVANQAKLIQSLQVPELWLEVSNLTTPSSATATVQGSVTFTDTATPPTVTVSFPDNGEADPIPILEGGRIDLTPKQSDLNTLQSLLLSTAQSGGSFNIQYGGAIQNVPFPVAFDLTAKIHIIATINVGG
jgi:hypothetical protein